MDNIDNYIDRLFEQKLSGAITPKGASGSEWLKVQKILKKKAFLKFSISSFNVYYLSAAIVTTITIGTVLLTNNLTPQASHNLDKSKIIITDTIEETGNFTLLKDTLAIDTVEINTEQEQILNHTIESGPGKREIGSSSKTTSKILQPIIDSVSNFPTQEVIKLDIPLHSEKTYNDSTKVSFTPIVESDTIVQVDTIHVVKKRRLFQRKK